MFISRFLFCSIVALAPQIVSASEDFDAALTQFEQGQYGDVLVTLDRYVALNGHDTPELHVFRAQTYFKLNKHDEALRHLERGIAASKSTGLLVKKNWWELMQYLYYQQGRYEAAIQAISEMDLVFPDANSQKRIDYLNALIRDNIETIEEDT